MLDFPDPDTVPAYVPKEQSSGRFKVSPVGLKESLVPRQRVVEDLIEQGTVNMIFGESSVGKSFVVVDLASSIANGSDWMGHPTVDGLSFFVAAEGASDLGNRCAAWRQFRNTGNREVHQVTPTDFCFTAVDVRDLDRCDPDCREEGRPAGALGGDRHLGKDSRQAGREFCHRYVVSYRSMQQDRQRDQCGGSDRSPQGKRR